MAALLLVLANCEVDPNTHRCTTTLSVSVPDTTPTGRLVHRPSLSQSKVVFLWRNKTNHNYELHINKIYLASSLDKQGVSRKELIN